MVPSVGRIVHYVSNGTPVRPDGSQAYASECRAAIVTEVASETEVGLCVLNPAGQFFNRGVQYSDGAETPGNGGCLSPETHGSPFRYCACGWGEASYAAGSWHWPERVGQP